MWKLILLLGAWTVCAHAAPAATAAPVPVPAKQVGLDSQYLERELQSLSWEQFRYVLESVPKLRADVDAYGPLGWQYVKANYARYHWKKNIDKLNLLQKRQLAALIEKARNRR